MSLFSKSRHDKTHHPAVSEDENVSRYVYLVDTLPAAVIESAHVAALEDLSPEKRRELSDLLSSSMTDEERSGAPADPATLAAVIRRLDTQRAEQGETDAAASVSVPNDARAAMRDAGVLGLVAAGVLAAHSVSAYFTTGAGSLTIADEPEWVVASYHPDAAGRGNAVLDGENAYGAGVNGFGGGGFGGASDGGGGFI